MTDLHVAEPPEPEPETPEDAEPDTWADHAVARIVQVTGVLLVLLFVIAGLAIATGGLLWLTEWVWGLNA